MENEHVLSGLIRKRAELAGEAEALGERVRQITVGIGHLDAAIRLFDPNFDIAAIRPKRFRTMDAAYQGNTSRAVLDVLREAPEPITTAAVAVAVMAGRGMDAQDREAARRMMDRIGTALRRQERNGAVRGERHPGQAVVWETNPLTTGS